MRGRRVKRISMSGRNRTSLRFKMPSGIKFRVFSRKGGITKPAKTHRIA